MGKLMVRKGDVVLITAGDDKGRTGKVLSTVLREDRVIVEGVNVVKRATRPTRQLRQGGIIEKPAPIHVSNVMLVCPNCSRPAHVHREFRADLGRVRVCRRCNEPVDKLA